METKPTDSDKMNNKTISTSTMYDTSTTITTVPNTPFIGPYNPNYDSIQPVKSKSNKNQTNSKKDYFPGPFSLQHLDEEARKGQIKQKPEPPHKNKPPKDNPLVEILAPFHLPAAEIPDIHHSNSSGKKSPDHKEKESSIPDSKFEDDFPDTNEGLFSHYPFITPPPKKPSKYDKDKSKPAGFPGLETSKQHIPYQHFNDDNTFSGLYKPSEPTELYHSNGNKSGVDSPLPPHIKNEKGGVTHFTSEADQEFQYEGDKHPIHPPSQPYNHDQIYFVHNQGFPQQPDANDRPNQDVYQVQHFQIPFDPANVQQANPDVPPPRHIKKKPIDKHAQNVNDQSLPPEILTHLHSLSSGFPKGGQIPPHLHPEEILHYVQPNPQLNLQQHPPAHYLTPEEIYLYQNPDKALNAGKIRPPPQPIPNQNTNDAGRDSIHIHSSSIPVSPSQRVEEILAHLRHQNPNQFPAQHFVPPQQYPETLLTQHSSHAAFPLGLLPGPNNTHPGLFVRFSLASGKSCSHLE